MDYLTQVHPLWIPLVIAWLMVLRAYLRYPDHRSFQAEKAAGVLLLFTILAIIFL